jgi:hypothetical protein
MMVWRYKIREERVPGGKSRASPIEPSVERSIEPPFIEPSASESPASADDVKPKIEDSWLPTSQASSSSSHVLDEPQQGQQFSHSPTYLAWWGSVPISDYKMHGEEQDPDLHDQDLSTRLPSFESTTQALVLRKTVDYEETEKHEAQTYEGLMQQLNSFYRIGNGADPFDALPQFKNPELSALYLTRNSE